MSSFLILHNNEPCLVWTVTAMKSEFYMTTSGDQFSDWTKKKLQSTSHSQLTPQKGHSHCLVACWWFDPLQLSESQGNHYIWEVSSVNWWDALKTATPAAAAAAAKSLQSCPTLCDPIDCSLPGSPVPGILQARKLEWVSISFSSAHWNGLHFFLQCMKVKVKLLSRLRLLATLWTAAHQASPSIRFSRQEYWSGVPLPSPGLVVGRLQF